MKIRTQLIITYLLVALLPLFFVSWMSYTHARDALIGERLLALESTTELKITAINEYFSNFSKEIIITKERSIVREYLPAIALLENKPNDLEYKRLREELDAQVNTLLLTQTDMEALFFVNPNGVIAYSSKKDAEQKMIGTVFPVLGDIAFQNGKKGLFLSDIFYDQANSVRDFIESAPMYDLSGNSVGVLIFQVKTERLFTLIQNTTGMGKTGETYVVQQVSNSANGDNLRPYDPKGDSVLFINTSRSTPKVAFNKVIRFGDFGELPVQEAVQGKEGAGISTDYLGKEVLAVWRYLPTYKWGFVTKIDMSEVLFPVYALARTVALFSLATIFIVLFFALFFANTISSPLRMLGNSIEKIKGGNLNVKIALSGSDEIGDISRSFNEMVGITRQTQSDIKKQIDDKTAELSEKNKDLDEQKNAVLSVLRDVEEEKDKSESLANDLKKFKLAVESASDMVVITDPDGILVYGSKAVKKITGYEPKEAVGKKAGVLWSSPMPKKYYEDMWQAIKTEKRTFHGQLQNRRKNGELYDADISISPVLDDNNNILFFVGIERDITKEKEIDRAKTEFVSLASHQLRTPLSSINWYTEMLLGGEVGELNENQKKYLNEVYASSLRMVDLVGTLLNVSRLELGTFTIEPASIDVRVLSQEVLNEMKPGIAENKISVKEEYHGNISQFQADRRLLRIVFQNLLSNAIKYSNEGGNVNLSIEVLPAGAAFDGRKLSEESMAITMSDAGIGIPTTQQDKIFSKLFRADNASVSRTEGTGLGLYIIKAIVEQSGGQIWFISEENKGTTFYVVFPMTGMKRKEGDKKLT